MVKVIAKGLKFYHIRAYKVQDIKFTVPHLRAVTTDSIQQSVSTLYMYYRLTYLMCVCGWYNSAL